MRAYVHSMLDTWGLWMETHIDGGGVGDGNILGHLGEGASGASGHKILCVEMPRKVWYTNYCVKGLLDWQREALHVRYVFHVKPDGGRWTGHEKARVLGLNYGAYRERVRASVSTVTPKLLSLC